MASNLGTIYYSVEARTASLLQADKTVKQSTDRMADDFDKVDKSSQQLSKSLNTLGTVIKTVIAARALRSVADMVQKYQTMDERVRMATGSTAEYELVQRRLLDTANGTYRALEEAQELYIQTSIGLRDMGYNTEETLDVVDSLSYAFVRNATSSDQAQSALNALTRAVNRGTVLTDHWATLLVAVPSVLEDIAAASGMTTQEVSRLGYQGKLSADLLTEGLRRSRDANKEAAESMATDLVDAGVRARNALTTVFAALEKQTGVLQGFTNGVVAASEAVLEFGTDAEKLESLLLALQLAGTSVAAVIAGRLLTAIVSSTKQFYAGTVAARAKAQADLTAAQAAAALAANELMAARAAVNAAGGKTMSATAAARLAAAETQATAATNALTAAQGRLASIASVSTVAMNGLRGAMAFLGGPAGIILLVAGALATFALRAREASPPVDDLTGSVADLGEEMLALRQIQIQEKIDELEKAAEQMRRNVEWSDRMVKQQQSGTSSQKFIKRTQEERAALEKTREEIEALTKAYAANAEEQERRANASTGGGRTRTEPATSEEGQKRLQAMRDEIELLKLSGEARERLRAIQRMGAEATAEEREEAARLASQIYALEEAQEAARRATDAASRAQQEAARAKEDDARTFEKLREQIYQTSLEGAELAIRQAELSLSKYATPEQVEEVKALARELYEIEQQVEAVKKRKDAFGDDVLSAIRGDVSPLSGGMFDDQLARYQAEEQAEQERYARQLERLQEAKELELEVIGGYQALELQMAQEHAARLEQIEQAKMQTMLAAGEAGFAAITDIMREAFGEQSALYKAAFVAQKAFAIAQSLVAIQQGIAQAAANPWPTNLGAMASVAAATAGLVGNIRGVTMGSGRQYGGAVAANSMYRVNENGAPEVFNAANGRQYMIPNQRGEVVSNRDAREALGAGPERGSTVNVNQSIYFQGRPDNYTLRQMERRAATRQDITMRRLGRGVY